MHYVEQYGCQIYNTASAGRLKKLESIHREGIRIYTGAFRTSTVESLHVEANDPPGTDIWCQEMNKHQLAKGNRCLRKYKKKNSWQDQHAESSVL